MHISNKILRNLMSGYEISYYIDKGSIGWSLLIKIKILVKYFFKISDIYIPILFKKVPAEVLKFSEVGAFYMNFEKELVGLL